MVGTLDDLLRSADTEWVYWGRSVWDLGRNSRQVGHTDDEVGYAQYVIDNYCSIGGGNPTVDQIANDEYYWSAVGMSAFFAGAGFTRNQFPFAEAHSRWIRKFIKARKDGSAGLYHGYRLNEATPDVGDMVGYTYNKVSFERAQGYFDKTTSYASHTDIVVARRPGEIDVIGANVLDSVTRKTVPLDATGHIADRSHKWFVVLKRHNL